MRLFVNMVRKSQSCLFFRCPDYPLDRASVVLTDLLLDGGYGWEFRWVRRLASNHCVKKSDDLPTLTLNAEIKLLA